MTDKFDVRAPFDGALLDTLTATTAGEVENAFERAYRAYRNRKGWLPKVERIAVLRRVANIVRERREQLALQVSSESGKPLKDALIEVDRGIDGIELSVEILRNEGGHVIPMDINATSAGRVAFTQMEPIGVVLAIAAFNHPFNLVIHQVAPAVAAGAPVIVKPSPKTPLSCRAVIEIFREAGLPEVWAQMVLPLDMEVVGRMVSDPRVAFLTFIGSAAVGWKLRSNLAPGARCALEHGGVAPVIVAADADLSSVVPRLGRAGFWHAGQACVSVQRVYCANSVLDDVVSGLSGVAAAMKIGDPTKIETDVGPLITHAEADRVADWVARSGAKIAAGGDRLTESTYANTVLVNPDAHADVSRREVFGPVICVYGFDDIDAALAQANDLPFSFQAAVFTRNIDTAMHCYRHLDGTAIMVNEHPLFRVDWMPFAGARHSGLGVGGIPHTIRDMQTEKMMVWRSDALN
ncbi:aldehyde dehydrogenase family protein [Neorhizobium galegae]|uniref:aldehyde dehydrogenase family protein n=1 Tax=Neorhizobium galegae TaxID=399 RepID=UPI00126F105C|nr:aldehyde dehydrogenase family protein [Neorhizobium galegae]KAA9382364.1 aldehyde dehydrogenase family protein [Neorhizobium galegae]KAB1109669.1 aldehyde dehydrogenase family protein [Neorhizobium galegae]MCM2501652.1 aldehyde dehydrogenase family protein [Neorhizobium galegae]MCQ1775334.1 aldehyde dehydrogenase family protein [Neorhizobium galegae]MCQ1855667.1 aldehyde dehydrogenase family protein [Neorhizobium galegae]